MYVSAGCVAAAIVVIGFLTICEGNEVITGTVADVGVAD